MDYAKAVGIGSAGIGATNAIAPKELGILQRVDGMRSGLQELRSRLERFFDRIDANAGNAQKGENSVAASLTGTLSDAENELRICLHMADSLHERF
jgi:hypothetical protein